MAYDSHEYVSSNELHANERHYAVADLVSVEWPRMDEVY
jgi:hypothetical protein